MDAKAKANFINTVACGQKIPCPSCNTLNDVDSLFCISCGTKLESSRENSVVSDSVPAFSPAKENIGSKTNVSDTVKSAEQQQKQAFDMVAVTETVEEERVSVFAQGLPSWDIIPPQIMVRRKKRK